MVRLSKYFYKKISNKNNLDYKFNALNQYFLVYYPYTYKKNLESFNLKIEM